MNRKNIWIGQAIAAGTIAGLVLAAMLYAVEKWTGLALYTLLMNVDYVPVLKNHTFPPLIEFSFHLIVSIALAMVLFGLARHLHWAKNQAAKRFILLSGVVGIGIWPVTALSDKPPATSDWMAFSVWLAAHLIYGAVLAWIVVSRSQNFGKPQHLLISFISPKVAS